MASQPSARPTSTSPAQRWVPALIGATIAVVTRSAAIAISVGAAWFIHAETLISAFWVTLASWGPAAATNALAVGGAGGAGSMGGAAPVISYTTAVLLAIGYGVLALANTSTVLARRDVTSQPDTSRGASRWRHHALQQNGPTMTTTPSNRTGQP